VLYGTQEVTLKIAATKPKVPRISEELYKLTAIGLTIYIFWNKELKGTLFDVIGSQKCNMTTTKPEIRHISALRKNVIIIPTATQMCLSVTQATLHDTKFEFIIVAVLTLLSV